MTDMRFESAIGNNQIKYLESLYNDIKNAYANDFSKYYNAEIEDAYEKVVAEYFENLGHLERCLVKEEPKINYRPNLELEKLKIPIFYGEIKEWANFHNVFQDMVHKNEQLSSSEKMLRLRLCLNGEAARLIQHLQISTENYEAAWSLLKQRYDNKRILFTTQWDRIMDQPPINSDNADSVRQLLDTTNECLNAIQSLGIQIENADPFIARVIVRKLDKDGLKLYEQTVKKTREVQTLFDIRDFLDQHFQTLKAVAEKEQGYKIRKQLIFKANHTSTNTRRQFRQCTYCKIPNHIIIECRSFKGISTDERHKYAKDNKICYRCLLHKLGETCTSNMKCKICNISSHHELLHFDNVQKKSAMSTKAGLRTVILATAQVRAKAANGEHILLRALIDQGSQITSISEEAAQILGVPKKKVMTKLHGLGDVVVGESKFKIKVQITPRFLSQHVEEVDAIVLSTLTTAQPDQSFRFNFKKWENYTLADPLFNKADRIDMVIGGDIFGRIIDRGIKKHNRVLAQATKFGWILSGIIKHKKPGKVTSAVTNLERFWELEEEQDEEAKVEDEMCLKKFEETTKQDADGRFIVEIPFKDDMELGDSRKQAIARLLSMEAKFK
ncbi:uncharacterized protein LOC118732919 [Rhagoletis pomonella]|uniref:uncharacterized protein LOC118732919 n=1 Tax=Rhagoletis pomonella TaxID=28610 RepID=UPI00177E810E|nr:uncharacterized protein LOC118732919 [Rhagoletis pomonella]